jgi:MoxR-like ATPase
MHKLNPVETDSPAAEWASQVMKSVGRVVLGKTEQIELCLTAALAGGHLLIEDAPGVGKTSLARALASALALSFARIQCTSDLLPSDIIGVTVFDQGQGSFEFREGPLFHQLVLVDELNRASPRTQSALLEAMAEGAVSLEGQPRLLPAPFLVIATQNPLEHAGTYPLPDSQLDRFLFRIALGYPPPDAERQLLQTDSVSPTSAPVLDSRGAALLRAQEDVREVRLSPEVADYLARLVEATRENEQLATGASTRGALLLARAARARALLRRRDFVLPEDVKSLLVPALSHRVSLTGGHQTWDRRGAERVIADIAEHVAVP